MECCICHETLTKSCILIIFAVPGFKLSACSICDTIFKRTRLHSTSYAPHWSNKVLFILNCLKQQSCKDFKVICGTDYAPIFNCIPGMHRYIPQCKLSEHSRTHNRTMPRQQVCCGLGVFVMSQFHILCMVKDLWYN